jgi:hypothetical protein
MWLKPVQIMLAQPLDKSNGNNIATGVSQRMLTA